MSTCYRLWYILLNSDIVQLSFFRFNCETTVAAHNKAIFRTELAYVAYYCSVNRYNTHVSSLVLNCIAFLIHSNTPSLTDQGDTCSTMSLGFFFQHLQSGFSYPCVLLVSKYVILVKTLHTISHPFVIPAQLNFFPTLDEHTFNLFQIVNDSDPNRDPRLKSQYRVYKLTRVFLLPLFSHSHFNSPIPNLLESGNAFLG